MVDGWVYFLSAVIAVQRVSELILANRNKRLIKSIGGREYSPEHYPLFFLLHISWFLGWIYEGNVKNELSSIWYIWLCLLFFAQILRYWCMASLGRYWNTRILIVPGSQRVKMGPYRFIPHPNYLAVAIELVSVPLIFNAYYTASVISLLNAILLIGIRIPAEEKALEQLK
ncbi:isoprenylcysteine carboxyl methyltransferase family protein [Dendrosporobacter sp. 1207_IL3150]|uniref:isoprenylcysteine carboxyl methyltransferase family protein n=1 Tax=Dendrosporobacter sp. 1207_IL3150 TaxID=3084054 RepID=UPI002FDB953D